MRATYILQETWPERSCRDDAGEIDPNDKAQHAGETRSPLPRIVVLGRGESRRDSEQSGPLQGTETSRRARRDERT